MLYWWQWFYYNKLIQVRTSQRERCIVQDLEWLQMWSLYCPLLVESGHFNFPEHWCVTVHRVLPTRVYLTFCIEFLLMFHYADMIDWIIGHMIQTQNWPSSHPQRSDWYHLAQKSQPFSHMVSLSGMASPILTHVISAKYPGGHPKSPC